jgi:hypothetical protein
VKTTVEEKEQFIVQCLETLRKDLLSNVNKMPENWDGWELRQYIVDKAENFTYMKMDKKRMREYKNDILIHGL